MKSFSNSNMKSSQSVLSDHDNSLDSRTYTPYVRSSLLNAAKNIGGDTILEDWYVSDDSSDETDVGKVPYKRQTSNNTDNGDAGLTWRDAAGNVTGGMANSTEIFEDAKYLKRIKLPDQLMKEVIIVQFQHAKYIGVNIHQDLRSVYNKNVSIYGALNIFMSSCSTYLTCSIDYLTEMSSVYQSRDRRTFHGEIYLYSMKAMNWRII